MKMTPTDTETLTAIARGMPMPFFLIGPGESILALSPSAEEYFGTALTGRHFFTVLRNPDMIDLIGQVFRTGLQGTARLSISDHAHDTVFQATCAPVLMTGGRGVMVCLEDTSSLEAVGQMRRDFVANVSHELRTPLTALMGFIETLRGPARDDSVARDRFLATMEREAARMNRLVLDLLSLSRVETQERMRPRTRVELVEILQSVTLSLRPVADNADVQIEHAFEVDSAPALGDQDQLMQVFTNLIENAIKYGSSGQRVRLSLIRIDRNPALRAPAYEVTVEDFGPGIDEIHLHRLTERFYRADNHRSRELGGTGLGLAIVKHIINRHRGRLRIDSTPGHGSRFSVILPASEVSGAQPSQGAVS